MTDWSERLNLVCFEPLKYERPWELATYEKIGGYQAWRKILADRGLVRRPFLAELRRSIQDHHAGYYGVMTWVLLMLELWMREHVDGASSRVAAGPVHAPVGEARP